MARTLVIKNADFSVNKVTTVDIEEDIPCTAISLNKSTSAITSINGTDTLTATTTPADTTDTVVWSTSNSDVATVAGGIVTATGCGTATITATCGAYSATCTVTVTHTQAYSYVLDKYLGLDSGKDYLSGGDLAKWAVCYSETETAVAVLYFNATGMYPFLIPNGADTITVSGAGLKARGYWLISTETGAGGGRVKACPADAFGSGSALPRTVSIPDRTGDYAGMDAVGITVQATGDEITDALVQGVTIVFSKAS